MSYDLNGLFFERPDREEILKNFRPTLAKLALWCTLGTTFRTI